MRRRNEVVRVSRDEENWLQQVADDSIAAPVDGHQELQWLQDGHDDVDHFIDRHERILHDDALDEIREFVGEVERDGSPETSPEDDERTAFQSTERTVRIYPSN